MNINENLAKYALSIPEILLPKESYDLSRWSVIACDQYTQDRAYWEAAKEFVAEAPSTLNIILPEVYLEDGDRAQRLRDIRSTMTSYIGTNESNTIFSPPLTGFMYVERKTAYGRMRKGLVVAIDLEKYEWQSDSTAPIRATEATIVDRIPPRMEIRRNAPLETPHIMLLLNDPKATIIEEAGKRVKSRKPTYETKIEPASGSLSGYLIPPEEIKELIPSLQDLLEANTAPDGSHFLFAVGDGNHSLATAKAVWDEFKTKNNLKDHNARYALVELVNLYDEGLTFEPIHRVLFGTSPAEISQYLAKKIGGSVKTVDSETEMEQLVCEKNQTRFGFVGNNELFILDSPDPALAVSRIQPALDAFLSENPEVKIDYIHGVEEVYRLGKQDDAVSILLPPVEKDSFFTTIADGGPLPRKSFSMGEASEKRYYLESRKLFS